MLIGFDGARIKFETNIEYDFQKFVFPKSWIEIEINFENTVALLYIFI